MELPADVDPGVLDKVVRLATELASEGREGHSHGMIVVVGDTDRVLSESRQLIMNPLKGYPASARNVLDPALDETVKELAALDGAFVIRGNGVIEAAAAYLRTACEAESNLPAGLAPATRRQRASQS